MKIKFKASGGVQEAATKRAIDNRGTSDVRKLHAEAAELHLQAEKALKESRPATAAAHHKMYVYHLDVAVSRGNPSAFGPSTVPPCYGALYTL
jgi:hypothetical protein